MVLLVRADHRRAEGVDHRRLALVFQGSLTHPQPILVAVFLAAEVTLVQVMLVEVMLVEVMLVEVMLAEGMLAEGMLAVSTLVLARPGTIHPDRTARMAAPMDLRMT